jgi:hypothetical protein
MIGMGRVGTNVWVRRRREWWWWRVVMRMWVGRRRLFVEGMLIEKRGMESSRSMSERRWVRVDRSITIERLRGRN